MWTVGSSPFTTCFIRWSLIDPHFFNQTFKKNNFSLLQNKYSNYPRHYCFSILKKTLWILVRENFQLANSSPRKTFGKLNFTCGVPFCYHSSTIWQYSWLTVLMNRVMGSLVNSPDCYYLQANDVLGYFQLSWERGR